MTTQQKLVRRKLSLLELAEYLNNVSQSCKITDEDNHAIAVVILETGSVP